MCGVVGFIDFQGGAESQVLCRWLEKMTSAIQHRGPDGAGFWVSKSNKLALGHRRLSILDLSEHGKQPMLSHSGKKVLVFNGELYNHVEIRSQLDKQFAGVHWRGSSDSEVFLEALERWGLEATLSYSNGMFAFALYDIGTQVLTLARDRLGEKPLYYGLQGQNFYFASELSAIRAHPKFRSKIDREALCLLLRHSYVPGPLSIYEDIHKLPAGSFIKISLTKTGVALDNAQTYWSVAKKYTDGSRRQKPAIYSLRESQEQFLELLRDSIKLRLRSDVPLGAFLSGGIDSSTVVALAQSQLTHPIKTFSVGFFDPAYNEAKNAKQIASHLGTDHSELYISSEQALEAVPRMGEMFSEPFADASQIPTFLISDLARKQVTVALSGDGGDELFCGYTRYLWADTLWRMLRHFPVPIRTMVASTMDLVPQAGWNGIYSSLYGLFGESNRQKHFGEKLKKLTRVMSASNFPELHLGLLSNWLDSTSVVMDAPEIFSIVERTLQEATLPLMQDQMMLCDIQNYMCDDILVKVDRCTMAASLEGRIPLLDHRLVEFCVELPLQAKINNGESKALLRQVLYEFVPKELLNRPKSGFTIPLAQWLRGELKDWAEELLSPVRLKNEGFFRHDLMREKWKQHLDGRQDWSLQLWSVLMFQAWLVDHPSA